MKKHIVLALALTIGFSAVAQKKELRTAKKELAKGNYDKAGIALDAAEALLGSMEAKYKSKYYLSRSVYYSKSGDGQSVDADYSDIKKSIEALQYVSASSDAESVKFQKQLLGNYLYNTGLSIYKKDDYESSSKYMETAYNLSPSDTINLYYAASMSVNAKRFDRSLALYEKLRVIKFTGIEKKMFATNLDTQEKESFTSETLMNISIKAGTHANPVEEFTKSKFPEIIKNIALIYKERGDNVKALEAFAIARADDPESVMLILEEANLYYLMGEILKFKELLELAVLKDPTIPDLQLNLGIISADSNDFENSKKYYLKAIELKSDFTSAYINLAALILGQEQSILDQMNSLGTTRAENLKYDKLSEKRNQMFLEAIPYLESAISVEPDNYQAAKTLSNIYSQVGNTEKYKEYKAIGDSLDSGK